MSFANKRMLAILEDSKAGFENSSANESEGKKRKREKGTALANDQKLPENGGIGKKALELIFPWYYGILKTWNFLKIFWEF